MKFGRKQAGTDFTQAMLPQNRKDIFFDVVRIHWQKLLMMGFVILLFVMPLFLLQWVGDSQILEIEEMSTKMTEEQIQEAYYNFANSQNIRGAFSVLLWAFLGVAMAGISRVVRQYAWEENVHFFSDFMKGIRDNAKHTVILCSIIGLVCAVCSGTYNMIPYGSEYLSWISIIQIGVSVAVVLPVCGIWFSMIPVYSNSAVKYLLFSFAVYLKSLFQTLIVFLLCMVIFIPVLLPMPFFHVIGLFIISFLAPFVLLAWTLYSYQLFDAYINSRYYPELVGKGIVGKYPENTGDK